MTEKITLKMIDYFGSDIKRINHALKVHAFTQTIAKNEKISEEKQQIAEITAILHDIGIPQSEKKYHSSAGQYQEIEGPPIARQLLSEFNLAPETLERIVFIIAHHHSYNKIDDIDFQILVEADFLVNIFEGNIKNNHLNAIKERIFKTQTGKHIFDKLYL